MPAAHDAATNPRVTGNEALADRAFGEPVVNGAIELPGVMSRKKQVAPGLLAAASG